MIDVLFVRPTLGQGGADRVTVTLLRELPRDRFRPSLALVQREGELLSLVPDDVPVHVLGSHRAMASGGRLANVILRTRPGVVFSTSGGTNVPAVLAGRIAGTGCRVVISERNVLFHGGLTARRALLTFAKRVTYPLADCITAVSDGVAGDLVSTLRIARDRVQVVGNPIITEDVGRGAAEPCNHPFFRSGAPVVVAAGRFVREKGFDVLLRAMRSVRDSRVCKLILLGEGPLRDSLNALVSEMGLAADVDFPGFERNPFKFMANADAFVLSSRFEGLPGVLIQAMACGAPVVATDCPSGPSEIISAPGKNGLLVPVDDVQALAAALTRLLDDRPLREMLRREAPRAVERFTVRSSLARYIEAIDPSQP